MLRKEDAEKELGDGESRFCGVERNLQISYLSYSHLIFHFLFSLFLSFSSFVFFVPYSFSIVNIEKVRPSIREGVIFNFDFSGDFQRGNVIDTIFSGSALLSLGRGRHSMFFLTSGILDVGVERAFMFHVRYNYDFTRTFIPEVYLQYEYNEPLIIVARAVGGVGMRLRVLEYAIPHTEGGVESKEKDHGKFFVFFGVSYMPEYELLQKETRGTFYHRISSYLSFVYEAGRFIISNVSYVQPRVDLVSDVRALSETSFSVKISENLSFNINLNIKYDSMPPTHIKPDLKPLDIALLTGISVLFKK